MGRNATPRRRHRSMRDGRPRMSTPVPAMDELIERVRRLDTVCSDTVARLVNEYPERVPADQLIMGMDGGWLPAPTAASTVCTLRKQLGSRSILSKVTTTTYQASPQLVAAWRVVVDERMSPVVELARRSVNSPVGDVALLAAEVLRLHGR